MSSLRPTRWAVAVAALGLVVALLPAAVHPALWLVWPLYVGGFALGLGSDALLLPRRRGVRCEVELPSSLCIGEAGTAVLELEVPSRRQVRATLVVDLSDQLEEARPLRTKASRAGSRVECPLRPLRRGIGVVERVWIRLVGPFGLLARVVVVELGARTSIVPDVRPVKQLALRIANDRSLRAGLKVERYKGDGTEFELLKEFVFGDDPRAIDWKASARHCQLVVRQHRAERSHQVILAVDSGRLMSESLEGVPKLDHAVSAALLLAYVSLRAGDRVGLHAFDSRPRVSLRPQGGMRAHQALVHRAAQVRYGQEETNYTLGLTALASSLSRRSLVVVLTDFVDTVTAELMIDNLTRLAKRHVVVFVALRDPELQSIAAQEPHNLLRLNQAVVAARLLRDREVVLRRLGQLGILSIDAEPRHVTPRLVNTYLEILRRERV